MRMGRKGFTLVEVLVTAALISVALAIAAAVVVTAMGSFARTARLDNAKQLGLAVYDYYENRLVMAAELRLAGEPAGGWHSLESAGGRIEADGAALYPESVYGDFQVSAAIRAAGGTLWLLVTVEDSTGVAFSKESALMLANAAVAEPTGTESMVVYYREGA